MSLISSDDHRLLDHFRTLAQLGTRESENLALTINLPLGPLSLLLLMKAFRTYPLHLPSRLLVAPARGPPHSKCTKGLPYVSTAWSSWFLGGDWRCSYDTRIGYYYSFEEGLMETVNSALKISGVGRGQP